MLPPLTSSVGVHVLRKAAAALLGVAVHTVIGVGSSIVASSVAVAACCASGRAAARGAGELRWVLFLSGEERGQPAGATAPPVFGDESAPCAVGAACGEGGDEDEEEDDGEAAHVEEEGAGKEDESMSLWLWSMVKRPAGQSATEGILLSNGREQEGVRGAWRVCVCPRACTSAKMTGACGGPH
jgi:hypothetical protein